VSDEKPHGNKGNKNALIDDAPADSWLQVRVPSSVKAGYVRKSQKAGLKLSAWIRRTLDKSED